MTSEDLQDFWLELRKGHVKWKFLEDPEKPLEQRRQATDWIIQRGFVRLFERDKLPAHNSLPSSYYVARYGQKFSVPIIDGKLAFFTARSYVHDYASCLNRKSAKVADYEADTFRADDCKENLLVGLELKFDS